MRPVLYAAIALAAVWVVAMVGYGLARNAKVTAEKVQLHLRDVDLAKLEGEARAKALARLAHMINSLPMEERRSARMDREWGSWFGKMTEQEKLDFIDATMPTGFKQMIDSFEKLPEEQRRRAMTDAVRRLREASQDQPFSDRRAPGGTNGPIGLDPKMQQHVIQHGLSAFYRESSAQTKAEVAPFLEELQRAMESGRVFRGR